MRRIIPRVKHNENSGHSVEGWPRLGAAVTPPTASKRQLAWIARQQKSVSQDPALDSVRAPRSSPGASIRTRCAPFSSLRDRPLIITSYTKSSMCPVNVLLLDCLLEDGCFFGLVFLMMFGFSTLIVPTICCACVEYFPRGLWERRRLGCRSNHLICAFQAERVPVSQGHWDALLW